MNSYYCVVIVMVFSLVGVLCAEERAGNDLSCGEDSPYGYHLTLPKGYVAGVRYPVIFTSQSGGFKGPNSLSGQIGVYLPVVIVALKDPVSFKDEEFKEMFAAVDAAITDLSISKHVQMYWDTYTGGDRASAARRVAAWYPDRFSAIRPYGGKDARGYVPGEHCHVLQYVSYSKSNDKKYRSKILGYSGYPGWKDHPSVRFIIEERDNQDAESCQESIAWMLAGSLFDNVKLVGPEQLAMNDLMLRGLHSMNNDDLRLTFLTGMLRHPKMVTSVDAAPYVEALHMTVSSLLMREKITLYQIQQCGYALANPLMQVDKKKYRELIEKAEDHIKKSYDNDDKEEKKKRRKSEKSFDAMHDVLELEWALLYKGNTTLVGEKWKRNSAEKKITLTALLVAYKKMLETHGVSTLFGASIQSSSQKWRELRDNGCLKSEDQ